MDLLYKNFAIIITIQLCWFLIVSLLRRDTHFYKKLFNGLLVGIPIGIFFDLIIGRFSNIFNYHGLENSHLFMIANGSLSYGIAIATANVFNKSSSFIENEFSRISMFLISLAAFSMILVVPLTNLSPLFSMFILGGLIIVCIEFLAMSFGICGPILLLTKRNCSGFISGLLFCWVTGIVYETANYIYPLWRWENQFPSSSINLFLIVFLGYYVLFHPIFTINRIAFLFRKKLAHRS
jgi:hypothetical protein